MGILYLHSPFLTDGVQDSTCWVIQKGNLDASSKAADWKNDIAFFLIEEMDKGRHGKKDKKKRKKTIDVFCH